MIFFFCIIIFLYIKVLRYHKNVYEIYIFFIIIFIIIFIINICYKCLEEINYNIFSLTKINFSS